MVTPEHNPSGDPAHNSEHNRTLLAYRKSLLGFLADMQIEAFTNKCGSDYMLKYTVNMGPTAIARVTQELKNLDRHLFAGSSKECAMVFGYLPRKVEMDIARRRQSKKGMVVTKVDVVDM